MSGFDVERVNKISQIMPQFSKVANKGDTVLMGLEGDPLFPFKNDESRPSGVISDVQHRDNDTLITLNMSDGTTKEFSSMTLAADQVWEFDDKSFQDVMERQKKEMDRAEESVPEPEYRGVTSDEIDMLKSEIEQLKNDLLSERENTKNFHNTMIASMNEIAGDICKMDSKGNAEFCRTLTGEYTKMMSSRAESSTVEQYNSTQDVDDFSADDTDIF